MKPVVIDASYAASWFLPDEASQESEKLLAEVQKGGVRLCVPELWIYEMTNLLRMAGKRKRLDRDGVQEAVALLAEIPVESFSHGKSVMARWMGLAERYDLSAYDAAYLELADRLQIPLKTFDKKLAEAARKMGR